MKRLDLILLQAFLFHGLEKDSWEWVDILRQVKSTKFVERG